MRPAVNVTVSKNTLAELLPKWEYSKGLSHFYACSSWVYPLNILKVRNRLTVDSHAAFVPRGGTSQKRNSKAWKGVLETQNSITGMKWLRYMTDALLAGDTQQLLSSPVWISRIFSTKCECAGRHSDVTKKIGNSLLCFWLYETEGRLDADFLQKSF